MPASSLSPFAPNKCENAKSSFHKDFFTVLRRQSRSSIRGCPPRFPSRFALSTPVGDGQEWLDWLKAISAIFWHFGPMPALPLFSKASAIGDGFGSVVFAFATPIFRYLSPTKLAQAHFWNNAEASQT